MLGGGEEVAAGRAAATRSSGCWGAVEAWRTGAPGGASWGGGDVGGVRAFVGTGARPMPVKASATPSHPRPGKLNFESTKRRPMSARQ